MTLTRDAFVFGIATENGVGFPASTKTNNFLTKL